MGIAPIIVEAYSQSGVFEGIDHAWKRGDTDNAIRAIEVDELIQKIILSWRGLILFADELSSDGQQFLNEELNRLAFFDVVRDVADRTVRMADQVDYFSYKGMCCSRDWLIALRDRLHEACDERQVPVARRNGVSMDNFPKPVRTPE